MFVIFLEATAEQNHVQSLLHTVGTSISVITDERAEKAKKDAQEEFSKQMQAAREALGNCFE